MTFRSRKLLNMARDQECVACGAEDGTIVSAHSNFGCHGKGMAMKASDAAIMHLCGACHAQMDQGKLFDRKQKLATTHEYIARTLMRLVEQGMLVPK